MKKLYFILSLIFISGMLSAQNYNNPESAVYDHVNDQYLISNAGNGTIVAADVNSYSLSSFISSGLTSPKGMCIANDMLYVTDETQVHAISLSSGSISQSIPITGAQGLNDITTNGDTLFISDMQGNKIFYLTIGTYSSDILSEANALDSPNGILFDQNGDLVVVSFVSYSPLQIVDRVDGYMAFSMGTGISNMDGITQDASGSYYISSWDEDAVFQFNSLSSPPSNSDIVVANTSDPADIYYDTQYDVLIVPEFNNNNVKFIEANSLGVNQQNKEKIKVYPVPGDKNVSVTIPGRYLNKNYSAKIFTTSGKLVQERELTKSEMQISGLAAGSYIIEFKLGQETKTDKFIITD
ncbi:MAG: T9SS type A sorting domain-containing protein [Bacteroidales bacterium]|nr:T9SS type A sorting domain-containing protein [Bacteroidales bacterium]MCF8327888.1 T9SS type A sorting domain-containing protein [Bacteroidales bacterium]